MVNVVKDLSDDQLQKLGVLKIGWQKNIKQTAQRFWNILENLIIIFFCKLKLYILFFLINWSFK